MVAVLQTYRTPSARSSLSQRRCSAAFETPDVKTVARIRFASRTCVIARAGHSLHFGLSAPPPASQVFATGVVSANKPCSNVGNVGGSAAAQSYST